MGLMWGSIENVRSGDPSPRGRPRYNAQIPGFHTIVWIPRICATVNSAGARPPCCRWREGSLDFSLFPPIGAHSGPKGGYSGPKGGYSGPKGGYSGPKGGYCGPKGGYCGPKGCYCGPKGVTVAQKGLAQKGFLWRKGVSVAKRRTVAEKGYCCPKGGYCGPKGLLWPKRGLLCPKGSL